MDGRNNAASREKLAMWKARLQEARDAYSAELARMDEREALYLGSKKMKPVTENDKPPKGGLREAAHVRNIVAENIEGQVGSSIPQPKVTARREQDEGKAALIENMLRNELNRLPFEAMNDLQERTVPIQGGGFFFVEWDNTQRTHTTLGEVAVSVIHPKQVIPQDGVYTGIEDMDYWFLELPQTKDSIRRRYGRDLTDESEAEPEARGPAASAAQDMVTQEIACYRNDDGGIGTFSWVNDTVLEDLEDCQARRLRRCAACGAPENACGDGVCPRCGGAGFIEGAEDYEEIYTPITTSNGLVIPGATPAIGGDGLPYLKPTRIPFYKPAVYPLVLRKNVSVFGRFLGDSDADKMADQQNTLNRLYMKLIDRTVKAGTRITLKEGTNVRLDAEDSEKIYVRDAEAKACIDTYDFSGDVEPVRRSIAQVYEEARQIIGITDSFQGRQDSSAASGVAKQFSAAQAAGRLESKRVMKDAAYADLFRLIFQWKLAYADEPRPVVSVDASGRTQYGEFNRYDFLERDGAGDYWWNDQFLFACDTSAPLANNREKMWENTLSLFQSGAFGDPAATVTLVALWTKLELLHYPGAGETRKFLENRMTDEKEGERI